MAQKKYGLSVPAWQGWSHEGLLGAMRHGWRDDYSVRGEEPEVTRSLACVEGGDVTALGERIDAIRRFRGRAHDIDVRFDAPGQLTQPDVLRAQLEDLRRSGRQIQGVEVELGLRPDARYPRTLGEMA